jgi:hypothetical protein
LLLLLRLHSLRVAASHWDIYCHCMCYGESAWQPCRRWLCCRGRRCPGSRCLRGATWLIILIFLI